MSDTSSASPNPSAEIGFDAVPSHYAGERETIDIIRDELGDDGFEMWCLGNAVKYAARDGRKDGTSPEDDANKMIFYVDMALHVGSKGVAPDPRSGRPDFKPYVRAAGLKTPTSIKVGGVIVERTALAAAKVRGKS